MDKIIIDNILKNFIHYLKEIGLLTKQTNIYFKKIFYSIIYSNNFIHNIINDNKNIKLNLVLDYLSDKIPEVIISFFKSLSQQNQKLISINIYHKYINKKENIIKFKLLNLLFFYYNNKIKSYFNMWKFNKKNNLNKKFLDDSLKGLNDINNKHKIFNLKINNYLKNNRRYDNNNMLNQYQKQKNNIEKSNSYKNNNTLKNSLNKNKNQQKNRNSIENINLSSQNIFNRNNSNLYNTPKYPSRTKDNNNFNKNNIIEKLLLKVNDERIKKNEEKELNIDKYDSNELTFKPKLFSCKSQKINKNKENHEQRIEKYNQKKEDKILKISQDLEKDFNKKYTFTPYINKGKSKNFSENKKHSIIPAYQRLYQDNKERKKRLYNKLQKSIEDIDTRDNIIRNYESNYYYYINKNNDYFNNNNISNIKRNKSGNCGKAVNFDILEDLYNDYKKKEEYINLKKIEVDKELGITFKPELYTNGKYYDKIKHNFFEREKLLLIKKQRNYNSNQTRSGSKKKKKSNNKKIKDEKIKNSKNNGKNIKKNNILYKKNQYEKKNVNVINNNEVNNQNGLDNSIDLYVSNNLKDKSYNNKKEN